VIDCLREDEMYCHLNIAGGPGLEHLDDKPFTTDNMDQLLTYYALKALEFPPPVILTPQEACEFVCIITNTLYCILPVNSCGCYK